MKSLSSIFSFDCLQLRPTIPPAASLAIVLVLMFNVWAYIQLEKGTLYSSIPRTMIEESIDKLHASDSIWWIGNSTLAAGLDERILEDHQADNAVVELGSATLGATLKLAEVALQSALKPPERIIFFFTKDDLNINGSRARSSKSYLQAIDETSLYEVVASCVPVYSARYAITDKLKNWIASHLLQDHATANPDGSDTDEIQYRNFDDEINSTYLYNLGKDFTPIKIDLSDIALAAEGKNTDIVFVAPPVSNAVKIWQEKYATDWPWERIVTDLRNEAREYAYHVLDYSDMLEPTTRHFRDSYHLNAEGSRIFTDCLITDLGISPHTPICTQGRNLEATSAM